MKKISKLLLVVFSLFLLVGCGDMTNNPKSKVEEFLNNYQTLNKDVLAQLDLSINSSDEYDATQKEKLRKILEKQYKNMKYHIKSTVEDKENATINVEVEVYNLGSAILNSNNYLLNNRDQFVDTETSEYDNNLFLDYRLSEMDKYEDRIKYEIPFSLSKVENEWKINSLSDTDLKKLNGLYY